MKSLLKRSLCLASVVLAGLALSTVPVFAEEQEAPGPRYLSQRWGDMTLTYSLNGSLVINVHGVELVRGGSMYVMRPDWGEQHYGVDYSPRIFQNAVIREDGDRKIIVLEHRMPEDTPGAFAGTQTITMHRNNSVELQLDFKLLEDVPAVIQWGVGDINSTPIIGCAYEGTSFDGAVAGTIPAVSPSPEVEASTILNGVRRLEIASRIGPIVLEGNEQAYLRFFDYRKNRWAEDGKPIFWFGRMDAPIEYGREYSFYARMSFPETQMTVSEIAEPVTADVPVHQTNRARVPHQVTDIIIPTPKDLTLTDDRFPLSNHTRIYLGPDPSEEVEKALGFLLQDLEDFYGIKPRVVRGVIPGRLPKGSILLGEADQLALPHAICAAHGLELADNEEAYVLHIDNDTVSVSAHTGKGVFHGVTTLVQLVTLDDRGAAFRGAKISDYPTLPFRGIHALSSKDGGEEIAKAVRDLMARWKINNFVWECQYIIWDAAPEVEHPRYGMEKADAQKVIDAARENLIELTPLVQSLGHSEWIFTNNQNLDIAEDPEMPYAYMPTNPRTYEFIFSVYQEALDFFQPRVFHIGHDEVTMRGRFPYRSAHTGLSVTELVMMDIYKLLDWFKERDVEVMLWGDMFLAPGDAPDATFAPTQEIAAERRELLPREIIVNDWHYMPVEPEEYISLGMWKDLGFRVMAATWYNPINIHNFTLEAINVGAEGLLQTTWAGFNFRIYGNEVAWHQYWVYILAAHYAWSGDKTPPTELSWHPREVFMKYWFQDKPLLEAKKGFHVDLSSVANRSLTDQSGSGWLGYGSALDLSSFELEQERFKETIFKLSENERGDVALLLAGNLNPEGSFPRSVTLELDGAPRAEQLRFLMASAFVAAEGQKVGEIVLNYRDGSSESLDLLYGSNVFATNENRVGRDARIAWSGPTNAGDDLRLWDLAWNNPEPGNRIESIAISAREGTEAAPVLFAITGVQEDRPGLLSRILGIF